MRLSRSIKPSEKSPDRFLIETALDFSGVSRADLLKLAAQTVFITVQRRWRAASAEERVRDEWGSFDVQRSIIEAPRAGIDPVSSTIRNLEKMSDEDREAILARWAKPTKKKAA